MSVGVQGSTDEFDPLVQILPVDLQPNLSCLNHVVEVIMDLGRPPEARLANDVVRLSERPVTHDDLRHVVSMVGQFSGDNRAGIERTLHRISAIRNRRGEIVGLTLRVGRAIFGTIDILRDLIETGQNILLLGRPGVGKTTKLREMARVLADELKKRVIVIDTSNEIGGDGDIPHPAIGSSRRMQVPAPELQHKIMIEAVENHMPEAIIVDEIGTEQEATAARTIAERGVQLIGTAHGTTLENLVMNPTVSDLVGGVHTVTLSDEEARKRRTPKTINERKAPPTFDIVIEMVDREEVIVYADTADAVDMILNGANAAGERRLRSAAGTIEREEVEQPKPAVVQEQVPGGRQTRVFVYGMSPDLVNRVIRDQRIDAKIVTKPDYADIVISLKGYESDTLIRTIQARGERVPVFFVKKPSTAQIRRLLQNVFFVVRGVDSSEVTEAVQETEHAIQRVLNESVEVALAPRRPALRRMQHQIISRYHLDSESTGAEPNRHLIVYPAADVREAG